MTHDELLIEINRRLDVALYNGDAQSVHALRAVVELHKPVQGLGVWECHQCVGHWDSPAEYPCATMRAIEKELG
jgi:hypothetical protein